VSQIKCKVHLWRKHCWLVDESSLSVRWKKCVQFVSSHVEVDLISGESKRCWRFHHASLYTCYHEHITKGGHPLDQWVVYTCTLDKACDWRGSPNWTQNVMENFGKIDQIVSHALMLRSKYEMMKTW
jgi:hypothetical protein